MKNRNIYKELFTLVKKTGEKLVVINPDTDEAVVVLRFSDYETLKRGERAYERYDETPEIHIENQKNFSFWDNADSSYDKLDKGGNSGRIDSLETQNQRAKDLSDNDDSKDRRDFGEENDDAGEGYVFEPIEEERNL